ncbi:MAG: hypothetical protein IT235_06440, partial [Bacteroidia bacterium]|nr:hypothetical protein [Bacteroidia bacterium]
MKIKLFVICLYLFARASGCDPDKVQPAIPDIYTPEEAKMKLQKWEEGKKSYKKNCGSC